MNLNERKNRIIARGEVSGHAHIITGEVTIERTPNKILIKVNPEDSQAYIKHLLESKWLEGEEVWTNEHTDIILDNKGSIRHGDVLLKKTDEWTYEYIQQLEYDPFEDIIRKVLD